MQLLQSSRFRHLTPAGLPFGIFGSGEEIEITIQQAAQPDLQLNSCLVDKILFSKIV